MSILEEKKTRNFRSLTVTLALAFVVLSLLVLVVVSSLEIYFNFKAQQKVVASQQQLIAQDAATTVKSFIQEKFNILEVTVALGNLASEHKEEHKLILEKLLGREKSIRQLVFLNTQEQELLRISRLSSSVQDQLTEQIKSDMFSQVSQGKIYISSVYIDPVTSEPLVILAVPVRDVFADFKGVLYAEVNLKFMWDLVGGIRIGNKGLAYVVDRQGNLIAFGDISRVLGQENLIQLKEVSEFAHSSKAFDVNAGTISKGIKDTYVLTTYAALGMPDWAVVVELPFKEAYEAVIQMLILSLVIIILSFILAIIVGIYLSRRITKPLISLRDAAIKICEGRLETQIAITSKNEIGQLAATFNQMTNDLKKSREELEKYSKELEKKVEERTKELQVKNEELEKSKAAILNMMEDLQEAMKKGNQIKNEKG